MTDTKAPPRPKYDPAIVNERINIRDLAERFGATFHRAGTHLMTRCILPDHDDRTPSLVVYPDTNQFYCFGCQQGGDPLRLIAAYHGWDMKRDFRRALEWGASFAGVSSEYDEAAADEARKLQAEKRRVQALRQQAEENAKAEGALKLWLSGAPVAVGDVAYRYLRDARGVDLCALRHWPKALRVITYRWKMPDDQWREFPAIATALTRQASVTAVHITALLPDGSNVDREVAQKGRIIKGSPRAASMRLARGKSDLSPNAAFEKYGMDDTLALTEGLEDALSVSLLFPDWRVYAAYSLDNIGNVPFPECASDIVLCAENDTSEGARKALSRVQEKMLLRANGRSVRVAYPPAGLKDWNEVHQIK